MSRLDPETRAKNRRLGLIMASIALAFALGFMARRWYLVS
ncbi:MAG: cytochrome oxidase small assembly protein [Ideonella sp.]|nr:cytochrome oxidase small assembly protein [Ideonella sp.]